MTMTSVYDENQAVKLSATFTVGGVATDPTTVSLTYRTPDGTETVLTYAASQITKDSVGNYHVVLTVTQAGSTTYLWDGTGTDIAAISGSFFVRRQEA
ncbi:MAG: hypothetical protein KGH75_00770 [Rhodospirillales bacterium]|nr:hypothetical protein [Rhodospirillales bacterium]